MWRLVNTKNFYDVDWRQANNIFPPLRAARINSHVWIVHVYGTNILYLALLFLLFFFFLFFFLKLILSRCPIISHWIKIENYHIFICRLCHFHDFVFYIITPSILTTKKFHNFLFPLLQESYNWWYLYA